MTYNERFEKLIAEYEGFISDAPNEELKAYFQECLSDIREMYKIWKASNAFRSA